MSDDIVRRSDELTEQIAQSGVDVPERIAELATYGQRNRTLIRFTAVGLLLDLVLSILLSAGWVQLADLTSESQRARDNLTAACIGLNRSRADQKQLWDEVIAQSQANPDMTPQERAEQEQQIADFRARTTRIFAQLDCSDDDPFAVPSAR